MNPFIFHLNAGTHPLRPLVREDADRHDLLDRIRAGLGERLLAYCVMDTHLHAVVEGPREVVVRALAAALGAYTRIYNARHREEGRLLRGEIVAIRALDEEQLATTIHYVHENPRKSGASGSARQIDYPWSSARAFAGLSLSGRTNVARARSRLGTSRARALSALGAPPALDLGPVRSPEFGLDLVMAAAAAAWEVRTEDLEGPGRAPALRAARAITVRLASMEGFSLAEVAPRIGRAKSQTHRLSRAPEADDNAVRVARTLLRDPALRRTLRVASPRLRCAGEAMWGDESSLLAGVRRAMGLQRGRNVPPAGRPSLARTRPAG